MRATPEGRAATPIALTGFDHDLVKPPDPEALDAVLASAAAPGRLRKAS